MWKRLDAAARRLNPILALVALGLIVIDSLIGLSIAPVARPSSLRGVTVTPPASSVLSADVAAALADMKDRD